MSFFRHKEIFPSDGGATYSGYAPAHRLDEFPASYSLAVCSPAWPASASPAGNHFEVPALRRTMIFQPTASCRLTGCLSRGIHCNLHGIIQRMPHSHRYELTPTGLRIALFFTRTYARLLRPKLAEIMPVGPPGDSTLRGPPLIASRRRSTVAARAKTRRLKNLTRLHYNFLGKDSSMWP